MSIIMALLTAAVLIGAGLLRPKKAGKKVVPALVQRYVHPGHAWVRETEDGDVIVGVDEFAQSIIGSVDALRLPRLLRSLKQGDVAWKLCHGNRIIPIVSPVSGRVVEKNEMAMRNPGLVNSAPYGDGWLLRIKPHRRSSELNNLLTGKAARQWQEAIRLQLHQFFSGTPALLYQDSGELVRDLSEKCSDQEWSGLVKEFFLVDLTTLR
jgi:glycine cleavage system H protein